MDTSNIKSVLSSIAILLTFVGYVPYIQSILKKKITPHLYSWCIWTLDGLIIFALQITHGAGAGALVALSATLLSITVVILTIRNKHRQDITNADKFYAITALIALGLWIFAKQPLLSAILIIMVDVLGFLPTVRKSWNKPFSENPWFYAINVIRFAFTYASLKEYSLITTLYPSVWFFGNIFFTLLLITRKNILKK